MITKSCPKLYKFLSHDGLNMTLVQQEIMQDIPDIFNFTVEVMNEVFSVSIDNLREYFDLSDFLISLYG